ncbi:MAG: hypothetical protein JWP73_49 [Phenylobacterium sp.]|nr:hypothetical protein [Phenylobacterium sp.]
MPRATRRRDAVAIALSAGFHLVVLAVLASQAPVLRIPDEPSGPPQPIIPLLLLPRVPPPASSAARPAPIRLHRRRQAFATPPPIPPLPAPPSVESHPAAPPGPVVIHPAPLPEGPKGDIRAALRASPVGCANPDAVGLNRTERAYCNEVLGKGAKTAPFVGLGLARDKQSDFDKAAEHNEACRAYRAAPGMGAYPGLRNSC